MIECNRFDVLVIGAGQAGIPLARDLAKAGKRVTAGAFNRMIAIGEQRIKPVNGFRGRWPHDVDKQRGL